MTSQETPDPRLRLLNVFRRLLTRTAHPQLIKQVLAAVSSAQEYIRFRRECGWSLPAKNAEEHVAADDRVEYFGRLYLALACHIAITKGSGPETDPVLDFKPPAKPSAISCDDDTLVDAAAAELLHASLALRPQFSASAVDYPDIAEALNSQSECGWHKDIIRSEAVSEWSYWATTALPDVVSHSIGNIAIDYSAPGASQSAAMSTNAEIAPLHIWLLRAQRKLNLDSDPRSIKPFTVCLFPSLLSALNIYSSWGASETDVGWWKTLDLTEHWVADQYEQMLKAAAPISSPLSGGHLARWHVGRSLMPSAVDRDEPCFSGRVSGPSHGAAFALGLLQAVARAHIGSRPE